MQAIWKTWQQRKWPTNKQARVRTRLRMRVAAASRPLLSSASLHSPKTAFQKIKATTTTILTAEAVCRNQSALREKAMHPGRVANNGQILDQAGLLHLAICQRLHGDTLPCWIPMSYC